MCNLCSNRLFLAPNPCCCCELRCGVMWTGVFDIIIALISLYYPTTFSDDNSAEVDNTNIRHFQKETPFFEIDAPWSNTEGYKTFQKTGVYAIEIFSAIIILIAANFLGGKNLLKFLIGCCWLIFRIIIFFTLEELARALGKSEHLPLVQYSQYLVIKLVVDVYFFIVVRYYTMDCYDAYRYDKVIQDVYIRREPPITSKAAPRTIIKGLREETRDRRNSIVPRPIKIDQKAKAKVQSIFLKKRKLEDVEAVPVWDRKNEIVFYGEDYTDWDPCTFLAKWEMVNEQAKLSAEAGQRTEKKSRYSNVAGLALALLQAKKEGEVPLHTTTMVTRKKVKKGGKGKGVQNKSKLVSNSKVATTGPSKISERPAFNLY